MFDPAKIGTLMTGLLCWLFKLPGRERRKTSFREVLLNWSEKNPFFMAENKWITGGILTMVYGNPHVMSVGFVSTAQLTNNWVVQSPINPKQSGLFFIAQFGVGIKTIRNTCRCSRKHLNYP